MKLPYLHANPLAPQSYFTFFSLFFIFVLTFLSAASYAETPTIPTASPQLQNELQSIDQEIDFLTKKLEKLRKHALNQEIHAQQFMIDNWEEFSQNIGDAEESEKQILEIKKQIKTLTERKDFLKNSSSNSP